MANPTAQVKSAAIAAGNDTFYWPLIGGATATKTYYPGQMIGVLNGYAQDMDDSADNIKFLGILVGHPVQVDADDANGAKLALIRRPAKIEMPIQGTTVSRVSHMGSVLYAYDSGKVTLDATTYGNVVGYLVDVVGTTPATLTSTSVAVFAPPDAGNFAGSLGAAGAATVTSITGDTDPMALAGLGAAQGGAVTITGGTSSTGGNAGGALTMAGGTGGAAGAGGAVSLVGGVPASGNAAGGAATFSGGAGSGTGAGGAVTTRGGASGAGATGNGGAWSGGGGAALSTNGTGGAATVSGGVATGTGTGGAVTIIGGASAGASGTAGSVNIDPGAAAGGTAGSVNICATNGTLKVGAATEAAAIKAIKVSGTIAVAVPTIADAEIDEVAVDTSGMTFAAAVGDLVVAIPLEALPTDAILCGAWVSATDTVTVSFAAKEGGSGVTGANKNFKFVFVDLT